MAKKEKILIVDDVASNLQILTTMLKDDYKIIATTKATKALELSKKEPQPDIILLDIIMPEIDGIELCRLLKQDKKTCNIPIMFITSLNSIEDQEKGLEAGGVDFIFKPYSKKIALYKIKTYLKLNKYSKYNDIKLEEKPMKKEIENEKDLDTILVVDDNPQNISVIVEILKQNYKVSVATNGKKALEILDNGSIPNIILLDIIMPNMDGFEVCKILKSSKNYKHIPIIFLTILENTEDIVKGLELGAVDYVSKPVEPAILKARVDTHINLQKYHQQLLDDIKLKDTILLEQSKFATIGEMFESIAHQWKQPLSVITMSSGNIQLKKDFGELDDKILDDSLGYIDSSINYLNQTIDDFREFLTDDQHYHNIKINNLIDTTLHLLSSKIKKRDIEIIKNIEDIEIYSNKNQLVQVLMNIFGNAIQVLETKENKGYIKVISFQDNQNIILKIIDNGGGIKQNILLNLFEKYNTSKLNGSGIGLYMSKIIVENKLGGTIRGYNIEAGACFEIILPKENKHL